MNKKGIDENFIVKNSVCEDGMRFFSVKNEPFKVYGVFEENGRFRRMPDKIAESVSVGVLSHNAHASGGRVRFKTDSDCIAIKAVLGKIGKMPHFALTGSAGFDLYADGRYKGTFVPPFDVSGGYQGTIELVGTQMRDITINFPLYSEVIDLFVGVKEACTVEKSAPYKYEKPIVFYGSSITQGGCASRPGNCYQAHISRALDCDFVNLGFSGNAMGEAKMAEYIASLDMSVFVMDYDANARTSEHLEKTHKPFFDIVREKNPELPIVLTTRPRDFLKDFEKECRKIVIRNHENAVKQGDKNVYLICGEKLIEKAELSGHVDTVHPNDLGFFSMANAFIPVLENILSNK